MNLMSEYIDQLRSLAASLVGGDLYFNERQRFFTQLIASEEANNLVCDSVSRNKIDLVTHMQDEEKIRIGKKFYYSTNSYLPDCGTGFIKRCKAILSSGGALGADIPDELQDLILS